MPVPRTIGRYEVLGSIGSGGMGTLLRARDPKIGGRTVAIKLLKEGIDNDEIRRRFMQEANAAGVLEHENIVRIFDVGEERGEPFIAMEFVDGETLSTWIRRKEPADVVRKLRLLEDLCDGLAYAHSFNIVHRDIKPANLMVEKRRGRLKILDFGIAKVADSGITNAGALIGSFNYMSPEQVRGFPIDHRSDIFSVGAVMFELLSYKQAFPGGLGEGVLGRIAEQPSPKLRDVIADADPEVEQIVDKALEKAPDLRYADLRTMQRDIVRVRRRLEQQESRGDTAAGVSSADVLMTRGAPAAQEPSRKEALLDAMLADAAARYASGAYDAAIVRCDAALRIEPAHGEALRLRREAVVARQNADERRKAAARAAGLPEAPPKAKKDENTSASFVRPVEATIFGSAPVVAPPDATMLGVPAAARPAAPAAPSDDADQSVLLRVPVDGQLGPSAVLIVAECPDWQLRHKRLEVTIPRFAIGRAEASDLMLTDPEVSRTHVVIELVAGDFFVRDESSVNGTYLNGRRLPPAVAEPLIYGTSLRVGSTVLTFSHGRDTTLPDLTQATIEQRYTLEKRIRQSMQGAVYAARDRNTRTRVAIKLTSPELFRHSAYRRQFEREVEMVSQLDHPHISRVTDSYSEADVRPLSGPPQRMPALCYVLYEGGTLQDVIDAKTPVAREEIGRWVVQIADALDHAHQRQIVHANLKPTAIVFDGTRTHPYLSDFAIAHRLAGEGGKTPVTGTPTFMAPEQWEGAALTPAVDQFALAAVAYYLLTGLRPFEAQDNPIVRQRNFVNGAPAAHDEAARNGRPDVPAAVSPVLRRGLATKPEDRFTSIGAFAEAFTSALRGQARDAAPRVFFSYRREASAGWVWTFSKALREDHGIHSFVDVAQMDRAVRFPAKLEHEIRTCDVFVCFLTGNTLQSEWVRKEIQLAREYGRPMVPVVDDSFVRPPDLTDAALIELLEFDFVRLYGDYVDEAIGRLASRIKRTCAAAGRTPEPRPDRAKGAGTP